jgi:molybdopterin-biosynthesis enzyme MoeA-like protein
MMEWVLDTQYKHLFNQTPFAEEIIVIDGAGESAMLDAMNHIVATYPTVKLSSLPQFVATATNGRIIELSIRGDPKAVPIAMQDMQQQIHKLGFTFRVK